MTLSFIRFAGIMLAALSLSFGLGHFMELPARMAWDQFLWVGSTVQGGLYALSGPLGVLIQIATVIALTVLAMLLRRRGASGVPFTIVAAAMFARPPHVVDPGLSGECRARQMGQWAGASELGGLAVAVGMGPGGKWPRPARRLRGIDRFGSGEKRRRTKRTRRIRSSAVTTLPPSKINCVNNVRRASRRHLK